MPCQAGVVTPAQAPTGRRVAVLTGVLLAGLLLDAYTLLLVPLRVHGQLLPVAGLLAGAANAALGRLAGRALASRLPAQLLAGLVLVVAIAGAGTGPGGDLLVTRDLQTAYLLYVVLALLGACLPLLRPRRG